MTTQAKIVAGVVVAVIIAAAFFVGTKISTPNSFGASADSTNYTKLGVKELKVGIGCDSSFGYGSCTGSFNAATSSLSTYWNMGGIDYASVQISMAATSSVPCSIPNPFGSSPAMVLNAYARVTTNGIGSAQTIDMATSSTALATSSPMFVKLFSASASTFNLPWTPGMGSTSPSVLGYDTWFRTGVSPYMISANGAAEFLNWRIASGTPGTYSAYYTGTCSATFMKD